jgi:serine/threonine-protein kinase RsbT
MARDAAKALGFGAIDQARIATAVSELARNIFLYAGTGNVTVREVEKPGRKGIEIVCEDQGPGIANVDLVMQDGYSTSRGMGMGLPHSLVRGQRHHDHLSQMAGITARYRPQQPRRGRGG